MSALLSLKLQPAPHHDSIRVTSSAITSVPQNNSVCLLSINVNDLTRSHKFTDRDHAGLAEGTASPQEHLPRYFAKHGHEGVDPKKIKKNGGGRSNWGNAGEEVVDEDFRFTNPRRRTNSSGYADGLSAFKTKFEVNEPEPVFEESIHGPADEDSDHHGEELTKIETSESGGSSYGDDKVTKH